MEKLIELNSLGDCWELELVYRLQSLEADGLHVVHGWLALWLLLVRQDRGLVEHFSLVGHTHLLLVSDVEESVLEGSIVLESRENELSVAAFIDEILYSSVVGLDVLCSLRLGMEPLESGLH